MKKVVGMKFLGRFSSWILWGFAIVALAASAVAVGSMLSYFRIATVTDSSASPVAFDGSLAIAIQRESDTVQLGDVLLIGAHSSGTTIGEVVAVESQGQQISVLLQAPGLPTPDPWSYELSTYTYELFVAIPLLGYVYSSFEAFGLPWLFVGLSVLITAAALVLVRKTFFREPPEGEQAWFASIPEHHEPNLELLSEIFVHAGAEAPTITTQEDTSWSRRRRP